MASKKPGKLTQDKLGSPNSRKALPLCKANAPHWVPLTKGTAIGYYKGVRERTWYVRQRVGDRYVKQRLGAVDDFAPADGKVVLSHTQAVALASSTQVEQREALPRHYGDGDTLNAIVQTYLEERQVTPGGRSNRVMAASTAKVLEQFWNVHGKHGIGMKLVTAVDAKALRKWHAGLAAKAPRVRGKAMPFDAADPEQVRARRSTANRILTIPKAALSWARKHDRLPVDMPDWWRNVDPFNLGEDPIPRMLDTTEITRLLNAAEPDLRDLLAGALMTGARYSDLRAMRCRDFAAETATVRIAGSKTGKVQQQRLTGEGVALFERLTAGREPDAFIFTRADGSAWAQKDAIRPMRAAREAAKLEDVSFKTTRATYGKLLLLATKDIELVAKALGHSDSRITRKHYAQYLPNEVAAGIDKLPALGLAQDNKVSRIGKKRQARAA